MYPFEGGPAVFVGLGVAILRCPTVIDGDDDGIAVPDNVAAENVVDGAVCGAVSEAPAVEEDDYGDDFGGAERAEELLLDLPPMGTFFRGGSVDSVEEIDGSLVDVEGVDAVDGIDVGGDFPVEELGELTVECPVSSPEQGVSQLEV